MKSRIVVTNIGDLVSDTIACPRCGVKIPKINATCPHCNLDLTCDHEWDETGDPEWDNFGHDIYVNAICTKCGVEGTAWYTYSNTKIDKK